MMSFLAKLQRKRKKPYLMLGNTGFGGGGASFSLEGAGEDVRDWIGNE